MNADLKSKAKDWIMVRLQRTTHAALLALSARLQTAYERGNHRLHLAEMADGLSLDALIARLLEQHERHQARRRKQQRKRRLKSQRD